MVAGVVIAHALAPENSIKLFNKKLTQPGYSLIAPLNSKDFFLVDNTGKKVHQWTTNHTAGVVTKMLVNGDVLRTYAPNKTNFKMGGVGGGIQILDWDGNVKWDYQYNSSDTEQHHDATVMPNGHILTLAWVKIPKDQAIAAGVNPANIDSKTNSTWTDRVIEIDPSTKKIVWQWDAFDHIVQDFDQSKPNFGSVSQSAQKINANYYAYSTKPDWLHTNAINFNPKSNQIMISAREFNEFWIIDHSTTTAEAKTSTGGDSGMGGDLIYRYGNPAAYGQGTEADRKLFLQHDVHWIDDGLPGAGDVLLFDNGDRDHNHAFSSAIELKLPIAGNTYAKNSQGGYQAADTVWQYGIRTGNESIFSNIMGSAQRLPNGNTLITDAVHGRAVEVTKDGKRTWIYKSLIFSDDPYNPGQQTNNVFRIYKYAADSQELNGKLAN
jgi:hypothetical protein